MNRCTTMSSVRAVRMRSRHSSWRRSRRGPNALGITVVASVVSLPAVAIRSLDQAGPAALGRHREIVDHELAVAHEAGPGLDRCAVDRLLAMDGEGDHVAIDPASDRERLAGAAEARTVVGVAAGELALGVDRLDDELGVVVDPGRLRRQRLRLDGKRKAEQSEAAEEGAKRPS